MSTVDEKYMILWFSERRCLQSHQEFVLIVLANSALLSGCAALASVQAAFVSGQAVLVGSQAALVIGQAAVVKGHVALASA